jgi:transcriptional regulator with XRE-family HTH domain
MTMPPPPPPSPPSPEWEALGARLRATRLERALDDPRGFSLRGLAPRLGVSGAYLSMVERGLQRPTEPFLRNIALALGIDPGPLLALAGRLPGDLAAALAARPALAEALRALDALPEPELRRVIHRIRDGEW